MLKINSLNIAYQEKIKLITEKYSKTEVEKTKEDIKQKIKFHTDINMNIMADFKSKKIDAYAFVEELDKNNKQLDSYKDLSLLLCSVLREYPLNIMVKPVTDINVSSVNIKNHNGNSVRKDKILQSNKVYKVIREFVSSGGFRGGQECYVIQDDDGWTYNVRQEDFIIV
jgi:hypothetical protein